MEGRDADSSDASIQDELRAAADTLQATVYELFGTQVESALKPRQRSVVPRVQVLFLVLIQRLRRSLLDVFTMR